MSADWLLLLFLLLPILLFTPSLSPIPECSGPLDERGDKGDAREGAESRGLGKVMVDKLGNCEKLTKGEGKGTERVKWLPACSPRANACPPARLSFRLSACTQVGLQLGSAV